MSQYDSFQQGFPLRRTGKLSNGNFLQGGETEALARLAEQLSDKGWVAAFEKPKGDPAAFDPKPATTVLSPYLKFGCISARLFYESLQKVTSQMKYWVHCVQGR